MRGWPSKRGSTERFTAVFQLHSINMRGAFLTQSMFPIVAWAQSWCPPGATWTHGYSDMMMDRYGVTRVVHEGDTVVGGITAHELRETNVIAPWGTTNYSTNTYPPMITSYADGVVSLWDAWLGEYDTLMWFSAEPGQKWTAPGMDDDPFYQMLVLDTSTVLISGVPLRQLIIQRGEWDWMPPDTLRERIGFSINYLNGWSWFVTDMPWTGLICYHDDQIAFEPPGIGGCGYTLSVPEELEPSFLLSPNPGTDHVSLALLPGGHLLVLFDATGREVRRQTATGSFARIGTSDLPAGLYSVRVDGNRPLRWVKE